jgi:hypothetical protein
MIPAERERSDARRTLNRKRVADPALTSQTQTREGNHARVSLERFEKTSM